MICCLRGWLGEDSFEVGVAGTEAVEGWDLGGVLLDEEVAHADGAGVVPDGFPVEGTFADLGEVLGVVVEDGGGWEAGFAVFDVEGLDAGGVLTHEGEGIEASFGDPVAVDLPLDEGWVGVGEEDVDAGVPVEVLEVGVVIVEGEAEVGFAGFFSPEVVLVGGAFESVGGVSDGFGSHAADDVAGAEFGGVVEAGVEVFVAEVGAGDGEASVGDEGAELGCGEAVLSAVGFYGAVADGTDGGEYVGGVVLQEGSDGIKLDAEGAGGRWGGVGDAGECEGEGGGGGVGEELAAGGVGVGHAGGISLAFTVVRWSVPGRRVLRLGGWRQEELIPIIRNRLTLGLSSHYSGCDEKTDGVAVRMLGFGCFPAAWAAGAG